MLFFTGFDRISIVRKNLFLAGAGSSPNIPGRCPGPAFDQDFSDCEVIGKVSWEQWVGKPGEGEATPDNWNYRDMREKLDDFCQSICKSAVIQVGLTCLTIALFHGGR